MAVNFAVIQALLQQLPREEFENAIKNKLQAGAAKLDLVTREEFEFCKQQIIELQERINQLETLIAQITNSNT